MIPYARFYDTEESARRAMGLLVELGIREKDMLLLMPQPGTEKNAVKEAIRTDFLPGSYIYGASEALRRGRYVLAAKVNFGYGQKAGEVMDQAGAVDLELVPRVGLRSPAPLSELFGLPVLTWRRPDPALISRWSLSDEFGIGLISRNPTPLSSLFRLPVLEKPKKSWNWSLFFPMLINNPAPFSSMFRLKLLTTPQPGEWKRSFGFPLLVDSPAPLSRTLGMPILTNSDSRG